MSNLLPVLLKFSDELAELTSEPLRIEVTKATYERLLFEARLGQYIANRLPSSEIILNDQITIHEATDG